MTRSRTLTWSAAFLVAVTTLVAALLLSGRHLGAGRHDIDNTAFLDSSASETVTNQVSAAVRAIFSIDPRRVPVTQRAAQAALTGHAVEQYEQLYGPVLKTARRQGLSITTTVRAAGLTWLHGDEARLLILADQSGHAANGQSNVGATQLSILAELVDGQWKITGFELL